MRYAASRRTAASLAANDAPACVRRRNLFIKCYFSALLFLPEGFSPLGNDWLFLCYGPRVHILEIQEISTSQLRSPLDPHNSTKQVSPTFLKGWIPAPPQRTQRQKGPLPLMQEDIWECCTPVSKTACTTSSSKTERRTLCGSLLYYTGFYECVCLRHANKNDLKF